jgi:hypothetical protein
MGIPNSHLLLLSVTWAYRCVVNSFGIAQQIHTTHTQQLLEVSDLCDVERPDERSVMTYIASYFHAFSSMGTPVSIITVPSSVVLLPDQAETVSRRIEKFAELMQSVWLSRNDYERRVKLVGPSSLDFCLSSTVQ